MTGPRAHVAGAVGLLALTAGGIEILPVAAFLAELEQSSLLA